MKTQCLNFSISGNLFQVTSLECHMKILKKDFDHNKGTGPGSFIIARGAEPSQLSVPGRFHKNVHLASNTKRMLVCVIEKNLITITVNYAFVGHGYLQHSVADCSRTKSIHYHMYLTNHVHRMIHSVAFDYKWSFTKAGELVSPISSVFDVLMVPQRQEAGASGYWNSQDGDGGY